jgi:hypothetical protein
VLGGGFLVSAGGSESKITVTQSYPSAATTWTVQALEATAVPGNWTLTVYAVCGVAV